MTTLIAYDLGTGGCKASLYDADGTALASVFRAYDTLYPNAGWHEQRPTDWWDAVVSSTRELLASGSADASSVRALALSGQSLAVVPLDGAGNLLRDTVPIWSDTRPVEQVQRFFQQVDADEWYLTTGNGFSQPTYSVFKIMWYREQEPDMFSQLHKIVGSKDYINYRLTGQIATDHSYASGSGIYNLATRAYDARYLAASGLSMSLFPEIVESTTLLGGLTAEAAAALGLPTSVEVFCGGVDNSCMALGAGNTRTGRIYLSLGSSAWLAVSSEQPVVDLAIRPFVFAHVIPNLTTSATSIFAAGSAFRWARDVLFAQMKQRALESERDVYDLLVDLAMQSPIGANRLFFNPSLAGGSAAYANPDIRGAFLGLDLRHTASDVLRAVLEGIALDLCIMYRKLACLVELDDTILIVGGGSKSQPWRQLFANVFDKPFARASSGQDAASLGAAAVAAVGSGLWKDYERIEQLVQSNQVEVPDAASSTQYRSLLRVYEQTWSHLSAIADLMKTL